jgi:hypothetical protein
VVAHRAHCRGERRGEERRGEERRGEDEQRKFALVRVQPSRRVMQRGNATHTHVHTHVEIDLYTHTCIHTRAYIDIDIYTKWSSPECRACMRAPSARFAGSSAMRGAWCCEYCECARDHQRAVNIPPTTLSLIRIHLTIPLPSKLTSSGAQEQRRSEMTTLHRLHRTHRTHTHIYIYISSHIHTYAHMSTDTRIYVCACAHSLVHEHTDVSRTHHPCTNVHLTTHSLSHASPCPCAVGKRVHEPSGSKPPT